MNDLILSLIGLGVVFVVVVWGYNKLQECKYWQVVEKVFCGEQVDVLVFVGDDGVVELLVELCIEFDYVVYLDEWCEFVFEVEYVVLQVEFEDEEFLLVF